MPTVGGAAFVAHAARHANDDEIGAPGRSRTCDPRIRRRGPALSRLSVFLRSSAQPRVAAQILVPRPGD